MMVLVLIVFSDLTSIKGGYQEMKEGIEEAAKRTLSAAEK